VRSRKTDRRQCHENRSPVFSHERSPTNKCSSKADIIFTFTTHVDCSRVSIAFIRLCNSVCDSVRMIKPKRLKLKLPNLAQSSPITIPCPSMNIRSKGRGLGSQGQKVQKVATRQSCGAVSLRCDATQLDRATRTRLHGLSYAAFALYPASSCKVALCCTCKRGGI